MNLDKTNQVVEASSYVCMDTTKKVDKLITDARSFMSTFQNSFEMNNAKVNVVITSLGSTLHIEKDHLEPVRTGIKIDNSKFHSSISSKIDKLHEDLAMENKIMDKLAVKTEKVKVLSVQLSHANTRIDEFLSKKATMKSCIADVNALLSYIIETHDSLVTITVKKHLAEKLRLVFTMLNRLEGVSESGTFPK
ncbi:unnamed protein product [Lactuca saligna]|uniref:Uncharacterized protein n=1 Tax=Lactuca saligna TaxID=75948 RepID=A0AA35V3L3_LACSI|nr:unnamed protein product [Lactuca saligna]